MKKRSLMETNPYLKDPEEREARIILNVASSSAIEGISRTAFAAFTKTGKNPTGKIGFAAARSSQAPVRKSSPSVRSSD